MTRILIVEDNADNLDMLSRRLQKKGFEIVVAQNGEEAVDRANGESPDVILMDMHLPTPYEGLLVTRSIKDTVSTRHIPIIALTAAAMAGDREKALAAGCDEYETKPVDFARLLEKIQAVLTAKASS
jgi:two-component system, cell cycle response regulator DivK